MNEPHKESGRAGGPVLLFAGQGSYDHGLLHRLYTELPETRTDFIQADAVARALLGEPLLPLVTADDAARRQELAAASPDLQQLGIFLAGVETARLLARRGVRPALLLGHSFGELAALGAAEVFDLPTGAAIVCWRVLALRAVPTEGVMAALSSGAGPVENMLAELGTPAVEIAVLNHPRQTVVSGPPGDLAALAALAASRGVTLTLLNSRYPFHSSHLSPAVEPFARSLRTCRLAPPKVPVYLATEGRHYCQELDLPALLASQLTRRLDFAGAVRDLLAAGHRTFVEAGCGDLVSKLVQKNLAGAEPAITASPALQPGEGVGGGLERTAARLTSGPAEPRRAEPPVEPGLQMPVAVVAMGCVLPGAADAEELWRNVLGGVSGIVDLAQLDPDLGRDFLARPDGGPIGVVPDKTYTLLSGAVRYVAYDAERLGAFYDAAEFGALTRGQRLLAAALGQAVAAWPGGSLAGPGRCRCILGATADGSNEYDEALFAESVGRAVDELAPPEGRRRDFVARLAAAPGLGSGGSEALRQHQLYRAVAARLLGAGVGTYVVDAACASSLYSIDLGVKELRDGHADAVVAGGVFAPGPANNALFAQFRGLTPTASRPFDAAADGVVFGDGAAAVVLKRLPDALAAGDRVLGVIRGLGLSSDGKSPAINVPQAAGQGLAIRRAYQASGVPVDTVELVEAHATATPVGDAVELRALSEAFASRSPGLPRVQLGSVKALIGHTGWVSGVASLIKVLQAFAHSTIPPQHNFTEPAPGLDLAASPFEISRRPRPWPADPAGPPRRAGVNGFGFGGTNAHLVVEAYDEAYHRRLAEAVAAPRPRAGLVVVGAAGLFPGQDRLAADAPAGTAEFQRSLLRLPPGKLLLPDVTDHMDASQYLAALAAQQLLARLPEAWQQLRETTGVVVGLEGKTERGARANERIYLDRLRRLLGRDLAADVADRLAQRNPPSGPYTLSGLMPNVAASRVASLFDLKGPNLVIDMGEGSLAQAVATAAALVAHGDCRLVLAGGLNAAARGPGNAEGVLMLALTDRETARELGLPELAALTLTAPGEPAGEPAPASGKRWRGATGAVEILAALAGVAQGRTASVLASSAGAPGLLLAPPRAAAVEVPAAVPEKAAAKAEPPATHAYVQGTPLEAYSPVLVAAPPGAPAASFAGLKLLVLTDQPELWRQPPPGAAACTLVCPAEVAVAGTVAVDLSSEERLAQTVGALDGLAFDTVVAARKLGAYDARSLLLDPLAHETRLLDLLFAVCRHTYDAVGRGATAVYTLCLDASRDGRPHPYTGLLGGFVKSLARELPAAVVGSVHTDAAEPGRAWQQLALEMGQPRGPRHPVEVFRHGARRESFALAPLAELAADARPYLGPDAVVLATAGGRGVTAVLVEELLCRFGCTVVAVGRTDPAGVPEDLAALSPAELADFEGTFYRRELARDPAQKIPRLKSRFAALQAAHELRCVLARLGRLPGRFEYRRADLEDEAAVAGLVDAVFAEHGRLDLVLHGAGVQVSRSLPRKSLADFRRIVATKVGGLAAIYRACSRRPADRPVHFHLLTSAFSYLGNDGQPDYGAANEAMNRLAAALNGRDGAVWSSLAWLGWAGIGMTRGSEFAALAASRRLRGVTHDEGRELFGRLTAGRPSAPVTVLLAQGERDFYRPALTTAPRRPPAPRAALVLPLEIDLERAPFLLDHTVRGVPTLPGAFLLGIAAEAAQDLRPARRITAFENTSFRRFVRVYPGRPTALRLDTRVIEEDDAETLVRVRILADFVHQSGVVLQQDAVQTEIFIRLAEALPSPPDGRLHIELHDGVELPDPYILDRSPVRLNGRFKCLQCLRVNGSRRSAQYLAQYSAQYGLGAAHDPEPAFPPLLANVILVDAFWRFGTIVETAGRSLAVYVPERCERMGVYFDYTDFTQDWLNEPVVFTGANPRPEGDRLLVGPLEARDRQGRLRLTVDGGVCHKLGEIRDAF